MTILRAVMQKLSRRQDIEQADLHAQPSPAENSRDCELLQRLQHQRQLLEVNLASTAPSYQTMVLAVDAGRGLLWLDDLFPNQKRLQLGDEIHLQHHQQGDILAFTAPVVAWGASYGASGFAVSLPSDLNYQPRRRTPRWEVPSQQPLNAKIRTLGQDPTYVRVINLSAGGVRLAIPGNQLAHLRHGSILPLCEISLQLHLNLRCKAQVKAFRLERTPYRHTQVSLEFMDLDKAREQQLHAFVERQINLCQSATHAA